MGELKYGLRGMVIVPITNMVKKVPFFFRKIGP